MNTENSDRWIRTSTRLLEHPLLDNGPYDPRSAWMWMLCSAAWKQHRTRVSGQMVTLERGQVVVGRDHLASVWRWTPSRVRTFLSALQREGMIKMSQSVGRIANVATICNYEKYQSPSRENRQLNGRIVAGSSPVDRQTVSKGTKGTTSVGGAGDSGQSSKPEYPEYVLRFMAAYPQRKGASTKLTAAELEKLSPEDRELAIAGAKLHKAQMVRERRAPEKIKHPERFVRDRVFDSYAVGQSTTGSDDAVHEGVRISVWKIWLGTYRDTGRWDGEGPPPNQRGCRAPADLLTAEERKVAGHTAANPTAPANAAPASASKARPAPSDHPSLPLRDATPEPTHTTAGHA